MIYRSGGKWALGTIQSDEGARLLESQNRASQNTLGGCARQQLSLSTMESRGSTICVGPAHADRPFYPDVSSGRTLGNRPDRGVRRPQSAGGKRPK